MLLSAGFGLKLGPFQLESAAVEKVRLEQQWRIEEELEIIRFSKLSSPPPPSPSFIFALQR